MSDPRGNRGDGPTPNSPGRLAVPGTTTTTTTTTTTSSGSGPRLTTTTTGPTSSGITTVTSSRPPQVSRPRLDSWQQPSIRIRRNPSAQVVPQRPRAGSIGDSRPLSSGQGTAQNASIPRKPLRGSASAEFENVRSARESGIGPSRLRHETRQLETVTEGNRRRSSSDPTRSWNATHDGTGAARNSAYLPEIIESQPLEEPEPEDTRGPMARRMSAASGLLRFPSFRPSVRGSSPPAPEADGIERTDQEAQYDTDLIDILDTVGMWLQSSFMASPNKLSEQIRKYPLLIHLIMFRTLFSYPILGNI